MNLSSYKKTPQRRSRLSGVDQEPLFLGNFGNFPSGNRQSCPLVFDHFEFPRNFNRPFGILAEILQVSVLVEIVRDTFAIRMRIRHF